MSASALVKRVVARLNRSAPARAARFLYKYPTDPAYRSMVHLALSRPRGLFQPYTRTREDRYPVIFAAVRARIADEPDVRLLSFGCATGEEVTTLRRHFPNAIIRGLDINARSIAACIGKFAGSVKESFAVASSTAGEPSGAYDAIFCMAVLRHGALAPADVARCDHLIRFADFEDQIADFARCLKPGGLLALRHANFHFGDTSVAPLFETLLAVPRHRDTAKFGLDNRRLPDSRHEEAVFQKLR